MLRKIGKANKIGECGPETLSEFSVLLNMQFVSDQLSLKGI